MLDRGDRMISRRSQRTLVFSLAAVALAVAAPVWSQGNAAASVYRCKQANGAVAYQDYPCKGGVAVDIKPEHADPKAIERLRRAQADFDRAYAERRAAEAARPRRQPIERPALPPVDNDVQAPDYDQAPVYLFYSPMPRKNAVHDNRHGMRQTVVPRHRVPGVIHHRLETS